MCVIFKIVKKNKKSIAKTKKMLYNVKAWKKKRLISSVGRALGC